VHVRQAGSAVRPDKLRFDFTHSEALSAEDRQAITVRVNGWIKASLPVRWLEMGRAEAEELGAMALFGEKYGDWVRVVEVEEVSRELCGGTHVANTAEIGLFEIVAEGSSAANVRRIEAVTGPAAIDLFAERARVIDETASMLGGGDDLVAASKRARSRLDELEGLAQDAERSRAQAKVEELAAAAKEAGGISYVVTRINAPAKSLLELAGHLSERLGESSAVVLGSADGGKVALAGVFGDGATGRGLSAAEVVGRAAQVVGGGGGGRAGVAQAGGRDPERLDEALEGATSDLLAALAG
jgi:alanyl-tRNA synthetase